MAESRCKLSGKYKYWFELPSKKYRFFKVMLGGFRDLIRIPTKFTKYFKKVPNRVLLEGPSGNKWPVDVTRRDGDVFFQNGWEKFAIDNGLEEVDFLVFQYTGGDSRNITFKVTIFDATGCEREGAYFVGENEEPRSHSCEVKEKGQKEEAETQEIFLKEDEEESLQENEGHKRKVETNERELEKQDKSGMSKGKEMKCEKPANEKGIDIGSEETEDSIHKVQERHEKLQNWLKREAKTKRASFCSMPEESEGTSMEVIHVSDGEHSHMQKKQRPNAPDKRVSTKQPRQPTEKEIRAKQKAATHLSSVPSIMVTMRESYVCKIFVLGIPTKWAATHILNTSQQIQLRAPPSKKKWPAQISYNPNKGRKWHITKGWTNFAKSNKLEVDDVCVFELAQGGLTNIKPIILDVFRFRGEYD